MTLVSCSSSACGTPIIWTVTDRTGKSMPVDADPSPAGNLILIGSPHGAPISKVADLFDPDGPRYLSHFVTCPEAAGFRKR